MCGHEVKGPQSSAITKDTDFLIQPLYIVRSVVKLRERSTSVWREVFATVWIVLSSHYGGSDNECSVVREEASQSYSTGTPELGHALVLTHLSSILCS